MKTYTVLLQYHATIEVESTADSEQQALFNAVNMAYFKGLDPVIDIERAELLDEYGNTIMELPLSDEQLEEWIIEYKKIDDREKRLEHERNYRKVRD